jgi:phospholipid/cholesterol/gamma-HCH transport system permease protein
MATTTRLPPNQAQTTSVPRPAKAPGDRLTPIVQLGGMIHLASLVIAKGVQRPFSWGPEFAEQFSFTVRITLAPLCISAFALSFGPLGVQATGFFGLLGSYDRLGSLYELVEVRELAPLVVGIVLAGAAGTAICADLGARVVREEIPALQVMGVDPIKSLVLPRLLALVTASFLLNIVALISGLLGAVLVLVQHHQPLGPSLADFLSNATPLELEAATVKAVLYGVIIAVVCCYNGLNVTGGAEGVGRAVNRSVVIVFIAIGFTDFLFTQTLLATHPVLSQVRG